MRATVTAPAKINLTLEVTGRRPDGYHTVEMVMQTVDLTDVITVQTTSGELSLSVSGAALPENESNTVMIAARRYCETACVPPHFHLSVEKHIPLQAGLAGGSADAAGTLVALNALCGGRLSAKQLCEIGAKVGADVPFCLTGGTRLATGIGTRLSLLPPLPDCPIVIAKPPVGVSTAAAYRAIDAAVFAPRPVTDVTKALAEADCAAVGAALFNRFERQMPLPEVTRLIQTLTSSGALGACMTGSGSAVFGLFADDKTAKLAAAAVSAWSQTAVCRPWRGGPRVTDIGDN